MKSATWINHIACESLGDAYDSDVEHALERLHARFFMHPDSALEAAETRIRRAFNRYPELVRAAKPAKALRRCGYRAGL